MKSISYPGNKGTQVLAPNIINLIPPHNKYVELCLGSAGISRWLQLPQLAIGVEINPHIISKFKNAYPPGLVVVNNCAIEWLRTSTIPDENTFIYADPPYVRSSRPSSAELYKYQWTDEMHSSFLKLLCGTTSMVAISGYPSALYDDVLSNWNKKEFKVCVHGKTATEVVWYNYEVQGDRHDYRFNGKDKTDRQRIRRKAARWAAMYKAMPPEERQVVLNALLAAG